PSGRQARQRALPARTLYQPGGMHAITGTEDMAARNAFMTLYKVELAIRDERLHRLREAGIPPPPAEVGWIADAHIALLVAIPFAGDQGQPDFMLLFQRLRGALDKTLGPPERVVALPDNSDFHSRRWQAASTCSSGSV